MPNPENESFGHNMVTAIPGFPARDAGANMVRLRTLILVRWMAIAGQVAAILVASQAYALQLPLGLCALAVGLSVLANLLLVGLFPENRRLSEVGAFLTLLFDLCQLAFLLVLTGGLTNPFAILVLAPVTISASVLGLRSTLVLGGMAILAVSVAMVWYLPLRFADGTELVIPQLFAFGFWLSIIIGILFLGLYSRRVATEMRHMSEALLATQMALAREQKLTDLAGVVAAAAHELGTPLATIKLVSAELIEELESQPELQEDARLIREQADRCRDILRSMGRAGKDDKQLKQAPLGAVLREAAEPHAHRGKAVHFDLGPLADNAPREPLIRRTPEIIHGLRNLVQNAVDFAAQNVWIEGEWSANRITIKIVDDGPGYPPHLIGRIGDPFVRKRNAPLQAERPGYEGMGLGLFIAKTLLERTGAEISFANGTDPFLRDGERPERCGAIVEVFWPADSLLAPVSDGLGENVPHLP